MTRKGNKNGVRFILARRAATEHALPTLCEKTDYRFRTDIASARTKNAEAGSRRRKSDSKDMNETLFDYSIDGFCVFLFGL